MPLKAGTKRKQVIPRKTLEPMLRRLADVGGKANGLVQFLADTPSCKGLSADGIARVRGELERTDKWLDDLIRDKNSKKK